MPPRAFCSGFAILAVVTACATQQRQRGGDEAPIDEWRKHHPPVELIAPGTTTDGDGRSRHLSGVAPGSGKSLSIGGPAPEDPCTASARRVEQLWKLAVACKADADCNHYPSTCAAIGNNTAADELVQQENWRNVNCKTEREPFCGPTKPVCEAGACTVEKLPSKLDP